ncbi:hypothetical protein QR680_010690 [Steinernema hermaphroditum]|uniref:Uncharacterized protein n=1 Tax=Steinernema hermaphroditum TaxID=289476 RepID=A0AA39IPT6_9BILA|nr:hypothetical protein QR680_010690 [Steinernema hermaphroditum]
MFVLLMLLLLCPHALFVPFYNNMYFAYFDPNNPSNDFYFERTYLPSSNTYLYSPVDPETFPGSVIVTVTTRSSDGHKANIVYILSTTENTTVSVSSAEFVLTKFDSFQLVHSVEDGQNGEMKFKGYNQPCDKPRNYNFYTFYNFYVHDSNDTKTIIFGNNRNLNFHDFYNHFICIQLYQFEWNAAPYDNEILLLLKFN